jgi:hypothetical protein
MCDTSDRTRAKGIGDSRRTVIVNERAGQPNGTGDNEGSTGDKATGTGENHGTRIGAGKVAFNRRSLVIRNLRLESHWGISSKKKPH